MPDEQCLWPNENTGQRPLGNARESPARTTRSADPSSGRATWRRSTASWWRSTRISSSFASSLAPNNIANSKSRRKAQYTDDTTTKAHTLTPPHATASRHTRPRPLATHPIQSATPPETTIDFPAPTPPIARSGDSESLPAVEVATLVAAVTTIRSSRRISRRARESDVPVPPEGRRSRPLKRAGVASSGDRRAWPMGTSQWP